MTPKQQQFVQEYLVDLNATQAAIRAGYSPRTANRIASENLSKLDIQATIDSEIAERSRRTEVTLDRVVKELAAIAFADPLAPQSIAPVFRVRVADKLRALELLGKHVGMFRVAREEGPLPTVNIDASRIASLTDEELHRGIANLDVLLTSIAATDGQVQSPIRTSPPRLLG
jgi:phage terminase small subunit